MNEKTTQLGLRISERLKDKMEVICDRLGISKEEYIRVLIARDLNGYELDWVQYGVFVYDYNGR